MSLSRAIVGGQQAVLAVLLTMTITAFGAPSLEFGPTVLARPLWALLLLHSWQIIGQNRRNAWFAWSIEAGLLLLTTTAAPMLLLLLAGFAVATERGRRTLTSLDSLFAFGVIVVLALPYLIWLIRADAIGLPAWPALDALSSRAVHWGNLLGGLLLAVSAVIILVVLNSGFLGRGSEERRSSIAAGRSAGAPVRLLLRHRAGDWREADRGLFNLDSVSGGTAIALLMSGLAMIIATGDLVYLRRQRLLRAVWALAVIAPAAIAVATTLFLPWTTAAEVATSAPDGRSRAISARVSSAAPISACERSRAIRSSPA
jgi:hypothetical protein